MEVEEYGICKVFIQSWYSLTTDEHIYVPNQKYISGNNDYVYKFCIKCKKCYSISLINSIYIENRKFIKTNNYGVFL